MENRRHKKVGEVIKRSFSTVLRDRGLSVFQSAMISVTDVVMSPDLKVAKIYLSIFNADDKDRIFELLEEQTPTLRNDLTSHIKNQLRSMPEIRLVRDDLFDEIDRVNDLLGSID
jgi:ribosome-binding factor A